MIKKTQVVLICFLILTGCSGKMPKLRVDEGRLEECPQTPNCVNSEAKDNKHFIQPIIFIGSSKDAQKRLLNILNEWKHTTITLIEDNYIRAECVSKIFRFVDDVEFYFPETAGEKTTIHVRSASRVGHSDFGVNRKRIEKIRSIIEQNKRPNPSLSQ